MKNIVFMGTPDFSAVILEYLYAHCLEINAKIVGAYCQPDKPAGRGKKLQSPPVKIMTEKLSIPVFQPTNFKNQEDIDTLASLKPDVLVVAAYGLILPKQILEIPTHSAYNVHASLLPQWRGAAPVQRAILAGDISTGITIMRMEEGLDTGDMLIQQAIQISSKDTSQTLLDALADQGSKLMLSALKQIFENRAAFIKQNDEKATYAKKVLKEEYLFNWNLSSIDIERKVRALLNPRVEIQTKKGELTIQVLEGEIVEMTIPDGTSAGDILSASTKLIVATSDKNSAYAITKVKPLGKNAMEIKDFINGYFK